MELKELGKTREKIPVLGLGTWKMNVNPEQEKKAIKYAVQNGMQFIDTAEMYGTERLVGEALKEVKDRKVFLATKVSPNHFKYDGVIDACNNSLKRLGVKQIDLYQLHWPNHSIPIEETMRAMEKLVDEGKIRYIGVSNFDVEEMTDAQNSMKKHEIMSNQVEYSLLVRYIEEDVLGYCEKNHITVIAYSPLARGNLYGSRYAELHKFLDEIGKKHDKTSTQVALNWLISKKPVVAIPKASTIEHVKELLGAADWKLTRDEIELVNNFLLNIR